jgi:deferrochelatase/peroxidase EfeB
MNGESPRSFADAPASTTPLQAATQSPCPQEGILTRPPSHLLIGAFVLGVTEPAETRQTVKAVRKVIRRELTSDLDGLPTDAPASQPTAETGELGFSDGYDRFGLTVTVGFGALAYEKLGIAAASRPQDLIPIPWEQLADTPDESGQADLVVMIGGDSPYVLQHVLRRLERTLPEALRLLWVAAGVRPHKSRAGPQKQVEGRGLIGFLDGTSNLDPRHNSADRRLVFVDPEQVSGYPPLPEKAGSGRSGPIFPADLREPPQAEPAWTRNGSTSFAGRRTARRRKWP